MTQIVTRLTAVMKAERKALLTGDYARLSTLAARKEALIRRLEGMAEGLSPAVLTQLHDEAERLSVLLGAALDGVKQANALVSALRTGDGQIYGRDGRRTPLAQQTPQMTRRA